MPNYTDSTQMGIKILQLLPFFISFETSCRPRREFVIGSISYMYRTFRTVEPDRAHGRAPTLALHCPLAFGLRSIHAVFPNLPLNGY